MSGFEKALHERFLLQEEYLGSDKLINKIEPLVSVTVATYQQVEFIKECLDGILMQKVNFPYEVIIGEDGSIDGTQRICKEYAEKYPDRIRLFIRDRKLSQYIDEDGSISRFNGIWNRMSARGKYIAWCEGDDYWIDALKLQKQVDFLENNQDYGMVHTNYISINNKRERVRKIDRVWPSGNVLSHLFRGKYNISTPTVMFRFAVYQKIERILNETPSFRMGDLPLWFEIAFLSMIKYIPDVTTVYRVLSESASHSDDLNKRCDFHKSCLEVRKYYASRFNVSLNLSKLESDVYALMIKECWIKRKKKEARYYYLLMIKIYKFNLFNIKYLCFFVLSQLCILNSSKNT